MRHPCDRECARANNCGGHTEIECSRCGAPVLRCEVDDWGCCPDCSEEAAAEREADGYEPEEGYIARKMREAAAKGGAR